MKRLIVALTLACSTCTSAGKPLCKLSSRLRDSCQLPRGRRARHTGGTEKVTPETSTPLYAGTTCNVTAGH